MSRSYKAFKDFSSDPSNGKGRHNLRHSARDAQTYLTGVQNEYKESNRHNDGVFRYRRPGRGASGESSN
jgi:hypothetical protein